MKKSVFPFALQVILFCACGNQVSGQTWTSISNGNWNSAATWSLSGIGTATPPATLLTGMRVNIHHVVSWPTTFSSNLEIRLGAGLYIDRGEFMVASGVSMKNWGIFSGNRGTLKQCVFLGCGNSGTAGSGTWTTLEGGYTNMDSMNIEIAGDWALSSTGLRSMTNTCLRTGQNFSVSGVLSRDTIKNSIIQLGLHGSGNFQFSDASAVFEHARIWLNSPSSGNIQFNSGTISGNISAIKLNNASSAIIASSSVSGFVNLDYYCMPDPWNYSDPNNKLRNKTLHCGITDALVSNCLSKVLPVNFISLNATVRNNQVELSWLTSDETESRGFEVQRTVRNDWKAVGWVDTKSMDFKEGQRLTYTFTDTLSATGTYVYRIRHLSNDGQSKYSPSKSVHVNNNRTVVYPNANNSLAFIFDKKIPYLVVVYDMHGQKIKEYRAFNHSLKLHRIKKEVWMIRMLYRDGTSENVIVPVY